MISASDLIIFYLAMEMQALCFYVLASFNRESVFSSEAGLKYFVSGSFISGFFLLGVSFIYGSTGTINFNAINLLTSFDFATYSDELRLIFLTGVILVTCTLLFKLACAPFHFWSPDVYDGAPLSSTLIFSVVPKFALFYFFIKWLNCINVFFDDISILLLIAGILSAVVGTFFGLTQKRLKRLIIYSSIAQTGFLVASLSLGNLEGMTSVYFFLIIYLLTSILMWGHVITFYSFYSKVATFNSSAISSIFISSLSNLSRSSARRQAIAKIKSLTYIQQHLLISRCCCM
jgi:NADH-quinone oxidoreductase subunit N